MVEKQELQSDPDNAQSFKDLKDSLGAAVKLMDSFKQPLTELVILRNNLKNARENESITSDPAFSKFIQDDLAPAITKRVHKQKP